MNSIWKRLIKFWQFGSGRTVLAAFCAHTVSISIGICQGYSAILIPQLMASKKYGISMEEGSWIASLGAITNPVGSIVSGVLAEYLGRKVAIQISSFPFLIGWLCIGIADNIYWIYAGRLITGIAAGMASASYNYVSEISTAGNRGMLQSLGPINASFGILLTYILGYLMTWDKVASINMIFCIFTLLSMSFLPESPAYLYLKKNCQASFDSYLWFRRNHAKAQEEIDKHGGNVKKQTNPTLSLRETYFGPETLKPFCILVVLFLLQELSGIYTILFYTVNFFKQTDLEIDEFLSSIIVGVIRFGMAIVVAILINEFGRKTLCITSSLGMAATILPLALYAKYYETHPGEIKIFQTLPLFSVMFNVMFSMLGMLPIPYILVGEYFPLKVRSIMSGVVICMAQCFIFICVKIYPDMIAVLNFSGTLLTFFVASIVTVVFCKLVLPETKDKTLEEIEQHFKNDYPRQEINGVSNTAFVLAPEIMGEKFLNGVFTIKIAD